MYIIKTAIALTLALTGFSAKNAAAASDAVFNLATPGHFSFAASGELRPFSFMQDGKMVGFDIAVGKAIAKKLGLKPSPQKAKFSGIILGVKKGRYDAAVASQTITEKRKKQVNFTQPYYYTGPVIFTRPDSDIRAASDLAGKVVAVSRGSTFVNTAGQYTDKVRMFDSDVVALQALATGHYDAVMTGLTTGQSAIKSGLDIVARQQLGVARIAVTVAKGNDKLLGAINKALDELKASGELARLSIKWFGADITHEPKTTE